jgi:hypothetical protein
MIDDYNTHGDTHRIEVHPERVDFGSGQGRSTFETDGVAV